MIIDIKSGNPLLSYCVYKNPATCAAAPFQAALRDGKLFGWFPSSQHFRLWFKDSDLSSSFAKGRFHEFEYLDKTRYCSSTLGLAMIGELLSGALKKPVAEDTVAPEGQAWHAEVSVVIKATARCVELLNSTYAGRVTLQSLSSAEFQASYEGADVYRMVAVAPTVHEALNTAAAALVIAALNDNESDLGGSEAIVMKYARVLARAKAPFSVRSKFLSSMVNNRTVFSRVEPFLHLGEGEYFRFGFAQNQRADFIASELGRNHFDDTLVDIGCGEGYHLLGQGKEYGRVYGLDEDITSAERNVQRKKAENVVLAEGLVTPEVVAKMEADGVFEDADVLLVEVLEHSPQDVSKALLESVLATSAKRVLVTVPNKEFNAVMGMDPEQTRHFDHDWEPTRAEWADFVGSMADVVIKHGWVSRTENVGSSDGKNGGLTIGTIFTRTPSTTSEQP
jgi:hypothetical protein